jgi:DNA-binding transcriptional ArsR family regulator
MLRGSADAVTRDRRRSIALAVLPSHWITRHLAIITNRGTVPLTGKSRLAYYRFVSDVFEAIATPARRAILDELVERDGQTLFELCTRLAMKHQIGLTRQAISQHLEVLEAAGLVTTVRQGKYKLHYLHTRPLRAIVERWLKPNKKGKRE